MNALRGAPSKVLVVVAFVSLYLCWSATFTATRIGVLMLPATVLAGARLLTAACLMLGFCRLRGLRIFHGRRVMGRLMLLGVMLLFGGNIGLVWAEKHLPSGLAALIVAVVPLYVVLIEMALPDGDRLRKQGYLGLALGFCALAALLWPSLKGGIAGHPMQVLAIGAILLGAFSFALGSVWSRRMRLPVNPFVAAGWEMFAAGATNVILATLLGRWSFADWNLKSVGSVGFLVLFGSLIGFSSYMWLIAHVPVAKVATYAYVTPMLAVVLGAVVLGEKLVSAEYVGMAAILVSVALVTSSKVSSGGSAAEAGTVGEA